VIIYPWIIVVAGLAAIVLLLVFERRANVARKVREVEGETPASGRSPRPARIVLPTASRVSRRSTTEKPTLRQKLIHAGFYRDGVVDLLRLLRFVLLGVATLGGYLLSVSGLTSLTDGLLLGCTIGLIGTVTPAFALDYLKKRRQTVMRHALPDVLDVLVVCLQAGLSLPAALSRVAAELATAHPAVAVELKIVEREVQMGRGIGEAMRSFADRYDLEELRSMAVVINQADQFGTRISEAFKIFADSMRLRRQQRAEETAHKAAVKLVFPTALFIFPAMFVVTLGPAVFQAMDILVPILFEAEFDSGFRQ
jgi:tight adherence protein C